jgi:NodT family efflux transporter outer membrane factor (OMF) lipoprotein
MQGDELRQHALSNAVVPQQWQAGSPVEGEVNNQWLEQFHSPQLSALVAEALANNPDLEQSESRLEQAVALLQQAEGSLFPAVDLLGKSGGKLGGDNTGLKGALLSASWELDVWGRVRYGVRASESEYYATAADLRFARQSLAALVAKTWIKTIETDQQIALMQSDQKAAVQLTQLARQRVKAGADSEMEVTEALKSESAARDRLQSLQLAAIQLRQALTLLLGRYPSADIDLPETLPAMPGPVPAGLPSQLLERRPDVIAAELRVASAFNQAEAAKAALLPRISLTITGASLSSSLLALSNHSNPFWSAGASILAPIFEGGALRARVAQRNAEQDAALAGFTKAGLNAFGDVEKALAGELSLAQRHETQQSIVDQNRRQLDFERSRNRIGASDRRRVLRQQRQVFTAESQLLQLRREQLIQRIDLYLALGGGFS